MMNIENTNKSTNNEQILSFLCELESSDPKLDIASHDMPQQCNILMQFLTD